MYVDDAVLNNKFGWGPAAAMAGMVFELSGGFKGRIERGEAGNDYQRHVHIYKGDQSWSQNEDGSPHDDGKNSPGSPPSKVLKDLEKKKGWNWHANALAWYNEIEFDFSQALVDSATIKLIFPDGSIGYYSGTDTLYPNAILKQPSVGNAYDIYLRTKRQGSIDMDSPLFIPNPNFVPIPVIPPVPVPVLG